MLFGSAGHWRISMRRQTATHVAGEAAAVEPVVIARGRSGRGRHAERGRREREEGRQAEHREAREGGGETEGQAEQHTRITTA